MRQVNWPLPKTDAIYGLTQVPADLVHMPYPNPRNFTEAEEKAIKWAGEEPLPPPIGSEVEVTCNWMGPGRVIAYFRECTWFGVVVELHNDPEWHRENCEGTWHEGLALVFGSEIKTKKEKT